MEKRLYLLDMDGTLYLGDKLFDGTLPFLNYLDFKGYTYAFLTNNSSKNVKDYVKKLKKLGINATENQFVTSAQVTGIYLKKHYDNKKIYVSGTRSFYKGLKSIGLNVTCKFSDDVEVLVTGYDTELNFKKIEDCCKLLIKGVDYIATNCDVVCPTEYGFLPDCGSVSVMLKNATGRMPVFIGKPEPEMVLYAMEKHGATPEETVMVGDRIYTDIVSGIRGGVTTVLVLSGETDFNTLEQSADKPDYVLKDVGELLDKIKGGKI